MLDVMLDLETLATSPDSTILTCGAVKFDPFSNKEPSDPFYVKISVDDQTAMGRSINPDTVEWWSKQSQESQDEAFGDEGRISPDEFTIQLNKYLVGVGNVWAQGTMFDIVILENLYRMLGKPLPWRYSQIRDSRTLFDLGDDSIKKNNASAHNALADSYFQAQSVQSIYKQLGIKKKQ
jgi:hypothetical protein